MRFLLILKTAFWSLGRSKMRTLLTMLGIIIGVAAVVGMVSLGQGAMYAVEQQIAGMGVNLVTVTPGSRNMGGVRTGAGGVISLVPDDATAIARECPSVRLTSPWVRSTVQAVYQNKNSSTTMNGASVDFVAIRDWPMERGVFFDSEQEKRSAKVCVLGATVAKELFGEADPVNKIIRVRHIPFLVIGQLVAKGQSSQGQDQDDVVVIPWTTGMRKVLGTNHLNSILVSARNAELCDKAEEEITVLLRRRHKIQPSNADDFKCQTQTELLQAQSQTTVFMMTLVIVVATIALIVGGIGVMNIMLVTVLERTREIGIRMAIGARPQDILLQFLGEAIVLTCLGGLIGIGLGSAVALAIPSVLGWPTRLTAAPMIGSFAFSALVGIFFGMYPAMRASRQDPIDALRYE
jgi:putative ABC transport system permease protein